MLIVDADVGGRRLDVRVGARITEVGALRRHPNEDVVDARGGALIPGLHDHHLHLRAVLARRHSVRLTGPDPAAELRAAADRAAAGAWVRAVDHHEGVGPRLDRDALDAIVPERPVRVLHRTGEMWVLNTLALEAVGAATADAAGIERDDAGRATGRLFRLDSWLSHRLPSVATDDAAWRALSDQALARGVTGWTDATPDREPADVETIGGLVERGVVRQRTVLMCPPGSPDHPSIGRGPTKIVLDDVTLPGVAELARVVSRAHASDRAVAIHCVTLDQLSVALAALARAGAGEHDRIEHASVVAPSMVDDLAALGVTVVTQPGLVAGRGDDYLREVDEVERAWLYPCASLRTAGVPLAGSTDAPHTDPDPWAAVAAATHRRTAAGAVLGAAERLPAHEALGLFLGPADLPGRRRRVAPGEPGDLVVLAAPLVEVLAEPTAEAVVAVVMDGSVVAGGR